MGSQSCNWPFFSSVLKSRWICPINVICDGDPDVVENRLWFPFVVVDAFEFDELTSFLI